MTRLVALVSALLVAACGGAISPAPVATPASAGHVKVGVRPVAATAGAGAVWVPNSASGTLSRIDPASDRVVATIPIGSPAAMLARGCGPDNVHTFYSGSFLWRRCDLPSAAAATATAVWVTKNDARSVARVDPKSNRVVQVIPIDAELWGIAADETQVWITDYYEDQVVHLDARTGQVVARIGGVSGPTGVSIGEGAVWVVATSGRRLVRIDPLTDAVVAQVPIGDDAMGVLAALGSVWVENERQETVSRVDPKTDRVASETPVGAREGRNGLASFAVLDGGVWLGGIHAQELDPVTGKVRRELRQDAITVTAGFGSLWATTNLGEIVRIRP